MNQIEAITKDKDDLLKEVEAQRHALDVKQKELDLLGESKDKVDKEYDN